ncbi:helicase associated domain-containing protein [Geodermatophilus nigrescens]
MALSADQVSALNALRGCRWKVAEERWDRGPAALPAYAAEQESADPPQNAVHDGFPVGQWAHARRRERVSGVLCENRAALLESLPEWIWDVRAARWEAGFRLLQRYVAQVGHAHPLTHTVLGDYPVGM